MGIPKGVANFYGMITNIDDNVGRLRRWLRDNDLEENTLLIFMGDNGSVIGDRGNGRAGSVFNFDGYNAGMRGAKGSMYDGGHRVPFFLYWPGGGFKGGKDISVLASGIDILPTLIKICGLRNPENVHLDGRDISPLLFGKKIKWSDRMIVITQGDRIGEKNFAVLSQDWRLVDGPGIETNLELYDINNDPGQKENVADQHVDVVKLMWEYLQRVCSEEIPKLKIENPIIIGNDAENPARLDAHDWHQTNNDIETARKFEYARTGEEKRAVLLPWHQYMIRDHAPLVNGYWVVEVEKAGSYEFTLRQQPAEARFPLEAVKARLQIGDVDITKDVPVQWESNFNYEYWNCTDAVTFTVNLEPGKTHLRTWLINEDGSSRGAYFVYIRRL